jgi:diguanylate cyclase (GGDEF)-like protein
MSSEKDFVQFIVNTQISSDYLKFLSSVESFFKKKLFLKEIIFFYLPTNVLGHFPRRIITKPNGKKHKFSLKKSDLKKIGKKKFIKGREKIWFQLGKDKLGIYIAQSKISSKTKFDEKFLSLFLKFLQSSYGSISRFQKELSLVDIDDVTGLFNQRRLFKDLEFNTRKYKETKLPFSVLFIDIDHFKSVNDGSGHLVGSQLLSDLAKRLKIILRGSDTFYRYGGDEFVIILPGVSSTNGLKIGKRILKMIREKPFRVTDLKDTFSLSASIGVATFPTHVNSVKGVLELADNMLYRAKDLGRGRVCSVAEIFGKFR